MDGLKRAAKHRIVIEHASKRWEDGMPLGNGKIGCLIWGTGEPLRFHLDRYDLWDEREAPQTKEPGFCYHNLIKLVRSGDAEDFREHDRLFDDCYQNLTPVKLPAGALELRFSGEKVCRSELSLLEAETKITLSGGSRVSAFTSAADGLGYFLVEGGRPDVSVDSPRYEGEKEDFGGLDDAMCPKGVMTRLGYRNAETVKEGDMTVCEQQTPEGLRFAIVFSVKNTDAGMEGCFTLASNRDSGGEEYLAAARSAVTKGLGDGYAAARRAHRRWWRGFFSKSGIRIGDEKMERLYYFSNYLLGSSAAIPTYPMPLQGLWTADNGSLPPWKGDYHHDLNTQMTYWSYMKANHLPEGKVFCDYLFSLLPVARKFAREFFGTSAGALLPAVSSFSGKPLGGWPQYALNIVNSIWLCQAFDHYALYSGDEEFLRERAYPYFRETAEAVLELLEERDGEFVLPLSSSPEVYDNTPKSYQEPNTNNDLALLHYLFETLTRYSRQLGEPSERWENARKKLAPLALSEEHGYMMSRTELLPETHRHLGHLMAVYPLRTVDYAGHREEIDKSIEYLEILGHGYWVGFSFVWMSALYTVQGNGNGAYWQLKTFAENCVGENGFHLNGDQPRSGVTFYHYHPFTLEANFGYADAMQEMLLGNADGVIHAFPAVPGDWLEKGCEFSRLLSYGGVEVSARAEKGALAELTLFSEKESRQKVRNTFGGNALRIEEEGRNRILKVLPGEIFELEFSGIVRIFPE